MPYECCEITQVSEQPGSLWLGPPGAAQLLVEFRFVVWLADLQVQTQSMGLPIGYVTSPIIDITGIL